MLEDLTRLAPKPLERRLQQLAREALPCVAVEAFAANPEEGLTVGLWVESQGRRDAVDLARVLETEPGGYVETGWSLLSSKRRQPESRLLLRVHFERPVQCSFVVRFDVGDDASDPMRLALRLLLAANGFALGFDGMPDSGRPVAWVPAPTSFEYMLDLLTGTSR